MYRLNYPKLNKEFKKFWKDHSRDVNFKKTLQEKLYNAELKTIKLEGRIAQLEAVNDAYAQKMANYRHHIESEAIARRRLLTRFNNYKRSVESILSQFRCSTKLATKLPVTVKTLKSA